MNRTTAPLLFENNAGQLLADPGGFMRVVWSNRQRALDDTRALFNNMVLGLQRHAWSRILVNQLNMPPFSATEQEWIAKEWLPRAVREGGYRHGAVVLSPDVFVRLATAYITTHVQGLPLIYRSFGTDAEAVQWLMRQPASPLA